jgi:multiple sugar transport system ATP-binding protein
VADVTLIGVSKAFGPAEVIRDVNLTLPDDAFSVIVGPSGCGKSTLLRLIAGLEDPTGGDILIGGDRVNDVPPAKRGIAMVFQSYALYPHMTVYRNMAFGLKLARRERGAIDAKVREAARLLQIEPLLDRKPRALSGGQRQRVAIGRAIVREPKVFLFDEPLSNLDASLRVQMRLELARLRTQLGATMVYVTHDQVEAMTLADTIVVLNAGRVEQVGSPLELYHAPRNLFVAGFIGSPRMNVLAVEVAAADAGGTALRLPGGGALQVPVLAAGLGPRPEVTLGVRPEHLALADEGPLRGRVALVERLGAETYVYVRLAANGNDREGDLMTVRAEGTCRAAAGEAVAVGILPESCHLFGPDGQALPRAAPAERRRSAARP